MKRREFRDCDCGEGTLAVIDSRVIESGGRLIRRRRECTTCHARISTVEIPDERYTRLIATETMISEIARFITEPLGRIIREVMGDGE